MTDVKTKCIFNFNYKIILLFLFFYFNFKSKYTIYIGWHNKYVWYKTDNMRVQKKKWVKKPPNDDTLLVIFKSYKIYLFI